MPTATGKVTGIVGPEGKLPWKVTIGGKEYATFDDDVVAGLERGMVIEAEVASKKNGKFTNWYLNSWAEIDGQSPEEPRAERADPKDSVPIEVWEAKDRAIAMEAAFKASAEYMKAVASVHPEAVTVKNFRLAARAVYQDIQSARGGIRFPEGNDGTPS